MNNFYPVKKKLRVVGSDLRCVHTTPPACRAHILNITVAKLSLYPNIVFRRDYFFAPSKCQVKPHFLGTPCIIHQILAFFVLLEFSLLSQLLIYQHLVLNPLEAIKGSWGLSLQKHNNWVFFLFLWPGGGFSHLSAPPGHRAVRTAPCLQCRPQRGSTEAPNSQCLHLPLSLLGEVKVWVYGRLDSGLSNLIEV